MWSRLRNDLYKADCRVVSGAGQPLSTAHMVSLLASFWWFSIRVGLVEFPGGSPIDRDVRCRFLGRVYAHCPC